METNNPRGGRTRVRPGGFIFALFTRPPLASRPSLRSGTRPAVRCPSHLRGLGRRPDGCEGEFLLLSIPADLDGIPLGDLLFEEGGGEAVGQPLLDDPLQRP